jgi:arsenate reductase-like glutaredoxin family protein
MNKIFYLSTCDTCKRILKEVQPNESIDLQDIKKLHITAAELDAIHEMVGGSYEDLMNKIARIYKSEGLKEQCLTEDYMRGWILKEYSMLKRPLAIIDGEVFTGNSKVTVTDLKAKLSK